MYARLKTWDGFEKIEPLSGAPPLTIRISRSHRECGRHPKWTVKTYTEEIAEQKACCFNDTFGRLPDRVFKLKKVEGLLAEYEEETRI